MSAKEKMTPFIKRLELSKSSDSLGSIILRENPLWNRGNEENLPQKMKPPKSISKALISAVLENKKNQTLPKRPTMVKTSALLYEITERTNRLAQPRPRFNSDEKNPQRTEIKSNRIREATPRVIELSQPRTFFKPIPKPQYNVSPKALTAIATLRTIELSQPRKTPNLELAENKKKTPYSPCSARLEYLAQPRFVYQKKTKTKSIKGQQKNEKRNSWSNSRYNANLKSYKKYKKLRHKRKRFLEASGSSRSVIIVSSFEQCNHSPKSQGRLCKKKAKRKLTRVKRYIKKNPVTTLSNSDHRLSLKRCEGESIFIPTADYL